MLLRGETLSCALRGQQPWQGLDSQLILFMLLRGETL